MRHFMSLENEIIYLLKKHPDGLRRSEIAMLVGTDNRTISSFMHSNKGYSLFFNTTFGGTADIAASKEDIYKLEFNGSDFDIYFDVSHGYAQEKDYKQKFDNRIHFWLVLRGFISQEEAMFKEHHLFTYKLDAYGSTGGNLKIVSK